MSILDLQKIYEERIDDYYNWYQNYEQTVSKYIEIVKNGKEWTNEDLHQLIYAQSNGIANSGQWGTIYNTDKNPEYDNILKKWATELLPIICDAVKNRGITTEQYNQFKNIITSCCKKEKKLAANRILAAFLPDELTTTVHERDFFYVEEKLAEKLTDYNPPQGGWLEKNKYFKDYCNDRVNFNRPSRYPWQSSIFNWILRDYFKEVEKQEINIIEMMESYVNLLNTNHNLILTGAPGTGKTYLAKQIAQRMIFGETKKEMTGEEQKQFDKQCGLVQFHPSYDYTDFVEGLRPKQDDNGNVVFERKDGVFKKFCKKAIAKETTEENKFDEIWDKFIADIRVKLSNGELTKIGNWEYGLSTKDSLKYSSINTPSQYSFTITKKNILDTYCGRQARPSGAFQKDMLDIVQHLKQTYNLSDKPEQTDSGDKTTKQYVFIIDEINRGEISKIFGELFFSIDPGYRGTDGKVKTQYQNLIDEDDEFFDGFYVPENVYIIGTMNDIDRSVESMDFAFRRRFAFKEVTAEDSQAMLDTEKAWGKDNNENSLKPDDNTIVEIKNRMNKLNNVIWHKPANGESEKDKSIEGLSSAYHIGASYFLKLKNYRNDDGSFDYDKLWEYHLEGLLYEYLRGTTDLSHKMKGLATAYEYTKADKYE